MEAMETIRFQRVKHFTLRVTFFDGFVQEFNNSVGEQLELITFDRLESCTLVQANGPLVAEEIDWIVRNRELNSLRFDAMSVSSEQIRRFIGELPELREMSFDCRFVDPAVHIRPILNEANQLQRINIIVGKDEDIPQYLETILQLKNGWSKRSEKFVMNISWAKSVTLVRS